MIGDKRKRRLVYLVLFFLTVMQAGFAQAPQEQNFELLKNLDIYSNLIRELNQDYVDEIKPGELTQAGIDAMLESLDPYTNFIPESQVEDYKFITTGQYGGIGALIHQQGDYVVISEPYEGSPAQKSGLIAGDRILEINGKQAKGKTYDDVSSILKGQAGTTVDLVILRDGESTPFTKTITREIIRIDNIPYYGMVDENIGYIKVTGFTQNAGKETKQAFLKLKENNDLKGVILDLRGNGGGLLNEAVEISNIFVDRNMEIVSTRGKQKDKNRTHMTVNPPVDLEIPVVVLVDEQSASASEIVAGAMQDLDRAVIIGQKTFGKGLVQNVVPLSYNAQLKITVAKYYIPSGRCIQAIDYSHKNKEGRFGVIPDSLIRAFRTKRGRTVYDGGGISPDVITKPRQFSTLATTLYGKFLVFDFATRFVKANPTIAPAGEFEISDSVYNDFLQFIAGKEYNYSTKSERALEQLKKEAQRENYYDAIAGEYDQLKARIEHDKKADLGKYGDQVKALLKMEIVSRYYFQKGKIESALRDDTELAEAIATLKDQEKFTAILAGKYTPRKPALSVEPELDPEPDIE
jgi:carboxyl-terminal processing protease